MKLLILLFTLTLMSSISWGSVHFSRQWSRTTLSKTHFGFRPLNRMPPLLTQELVIQGNGVDGIKAFHRRSGHEAWHLKLFNGVEGGAIVSGNKLYFGSNDGQFYCLDVNSGAVLWTFPLNSESLTAPLVVGNQVYHVTGNNTLYALNKDTGETIWVKSNSAKSNMTVRGQTAPVHDQGVLYLGFSDGTFAAFNALNGRELWSKRIGDDKKFNDVDSTAVLSDSCLLVSSYANALYCLNKNTGAIKWRHDVGGYFSVLVSKQTLYYPTVEGEIHILDLDSGKLLKKIVDVQGLSTELIDTGDAILYGETGGEVILRRKTDLTVLSRFAPGLGVYARPSFDHKNNQVYFVSNDANLYRLDIREKLENPFLWSEKSHVH
jgi:outer membrane protein assembly factor BamB